MRIRGGINALTSSLHAIERTALNRKGDVGSFYNARTDNILITSAIDKDSLVQKDVKGTPVCKLRKVDDWNRNNILKLIGIEDDLRVSVALGMTTITEGTSMLYTYELPVDRKVRLIDYCRVDQEECLPDVIQIVRKSFPDSLPDSNTTHIITSVRRGIDFAIVLELPENANYDEIDSVLEKLCEYFIKPKAPFLSTEDQQKVKSLRPTIFTSITEIHSSAENKDLNDVCQHIHQYIYQNRNRSTLSYTLHPAKCIYYENLSNEIFDYKLGVRTVWKIEEKLLPLSNRLKRLEYLFCEKVKPQLSQSLKLLIEQTFKDLCRAKSMYIEFQQAVAAKVDELRQGKRDLSLLENALNHTQFTVLDLELKTLQTTILELQVKGSFITNTETDIQMKCANVAASTDILKILQPEASLPTAQSGLKPKEINILLIGETGVGKSTFINAFVNYLAFHSLQQAVNDEPIILIPVSFLITIGEQFEEKHIEFGQFDANEDHNQSGQSVTQHCQSYIFTIENNIKLRIIDTPGIGDTRGAEQDNENIEHILSYTSNLPYLNAICFLLKPNTTRLHALFRSCFTQLFNFLGPGARENIIFCFTNTRATFYAPGDTAKLLKTMLNELPNDHKPSFAKENTFCFDSESFRYLAVIKNGHTLAFDEKQKLDFERSWKISVTESIRLLDLVKSRPQYTMNKWHSIRHAQMMITLLVRPILETIRNALRNLILWDLGNKKKIIELKAQPISVPSWLCTACSRTTTQIENILIPTHTVHNDRTYHGTLNKHLSVFYELTYHSDVTKGIQFESNTEEMKNRLIYGSFLMTQFLLHTAHTSENPFLPWFDLLVQDEQHMYQKGAASCLHAESCHSMLNVKKEYQTLLNESQFDHDYINLNTIYGCIDEVLVYPPILEQMNAIKASQMKMMKNYEHDVSSQYPNIDSFL